MNVQRLRNVVDAVRADNQSANLTQLLTNLENAFIQSVQSPSPQTAEAFSAAKQALEKAVEAGDCIRLSPSRICILEKIGAADLCGSGLTKSIDTLLTASSNPAAVVKDLRELRTRATDFYGIAAHLRDSLDELGLEGEQPPKDSAEVEVRLPLELFDGSLGGFAKEAKHLDNALSDVVETVSGGRPPITIRTLAGGSIEVFVTVDPVSGVAIITLVTAIVNLINSILQNRKTRLELEKDNAPKELLEQFIKWEQARVEEELSRLRQELLAQSKVGKERKNELKGLLTRSLRYLADRMDRGMDIDVATLLDEAAIALPPSPEETADSTARVTAQRQISEAMNKRRRLPKPSRPVLELPPMADDEDSGKSKDHSKTKS